MGLSKIFKAPKRLPLVLPVFICGVLAAFAPQTANAQQYASQERTNAAIGHYARARTMLVQALAEFEQGRKYARPDMLLDPEEWRLSLVSRTEELNRILDPRPRVTRDGVRFQANKLLIRRERDRLPSADGAQDANDYGEKQRRKEMRSARARLESADEKPISEKGSAKSSKKSAAAKNAKNTQVSPDEILLGDQDSLAKPSADDALVAAGKAAAKATEKVEETKGEPIVESEEEEIDSRAPIASESSAKRSLFGDDKSVKTPAPAAKKSAALDEKKETEVSKAIEDALQERLKAEKPVAEKTEEEVLEDEIVHQ